jgi:threonyl-tRNA synthetase
VMIHRGVLGSMERLVSLLVEQHQGRMPLWLAPVQCVVLPVSAQEEEIAHDLVARLGALGLRSGVDGDGSLGSRVRAAHARRSSFVVIGPTEAAAGSVTATMTGAEPALTLPTTDFVARLAAAVRQRRLAF